MKKSIDSLINLKDLSDPEKIAFALLRDAKINLNNAAKITPRSKMIIKWIRGDYEENETPLLTFEWCCQVLRLNHEYMKNFMEREIKEIGIKRNQRRKRI